MSDEMFFPNLLADTALTEQVRELQSAVLVLRARLSDVELMAVLQHYYDLGPCEERGNIMKWLSEGRTVRLVPHRDDTKTLRVRVTAEVVEE